MPILTPKAIEGYKKHTERIIDRARFKIGSIYYDSIIHKRERLSDGRIAIFFTISPETTGIVTITEVQLIDNNNDIWASKVENIILNNVQEGVLYRFVFDIKEV